MLAAERNALPILTSLAVGLAEAIVRGEPITLPEQVADVLQEWLESPHGKQHFAVQEMSRDMKAANAAKGGQ